METKEREKLHLFLQRLGFPFVIAVSVILLAFLFATRQLLFLFQENTAGPSDSAISTNNGNVENPEMGMALQVH